MKLGIRIVSCVVLMAIALTMAVFTMADLERPQTETAGYTLGEHDGNLAVFRSGDSKNPITVTDIELAGLRQADRDMIDRGLEAATHEELLSLLEDLGS